MKKYIFQNFKIYSASSPMQSLENVQDIIHALHIFSQCRPPTSLYYRFSSFLNSAKPLGQIVIHTIKKLAIFVKSLNNLFGSEFTTFLNQLCHLNVVNTKEIRVYPRIYDGKSEKTRRIRLNGIFFVSVCWWAIFQHIAILWKKCLLFSLMQPQSLSIPCTLYKSYIRGVGSLVLYHCPNSHVYDFFLPISTAIQPPESANIVANASRISMLLWFSFEVLELI